MVAKNRSSLPPLVLFLPTALLPSQEAFKYGFTSFLRMPQQVTSIVSQDHTMIQNGIVNIYFMIQYSTPPYTYHAITPHLNICKVSPVCAERHFPPFHQCKWSSSIAIHSARNSPFKYYKSNSGIAAANGLIKIWNLPFLRSREGPNQKNRCK